MAKNREFKQPRLEHRRLSVLLRLFLILAILASVLVSLVAWFFPVEVFVNWAYAWAQEDEYKQLEAMGRAEFVCWVVRCVAPGFSIVAFLMLRRLQQTTKFVAAAFAGWMSVTQTSAEGAFSPRWRTLATRGIFVAWMIVALRQDWLAFYDNATSWGYFRFRSGHQVLPNISESNRDVIRYLLSATPADARIFIASDQKLYFLSYYLLPRRLYYRLHPDSEFVIALPHQQRRMEAYQLAEIDQSIIDRISPDYVLEYFEHPDFVDRTRLQSDRVWLSYFRKLHRDSTATPKYLVSLRRVKGDISP